MSVMRVLFLVMLGGIFGASATFFVPMNTVSQAPLLVEQSQSPVEARFTETKIENTQIESAAQDWKSKLQVLEQLKDFATMLAEKQQEPAQEES